MSVVGSDRQIYEKQIACGKIRGLGPVGNGTGAMEKRLGKIILNKVGLVDGAAMVDSICNTYVLS